MSHADSFDHLVGASNQPLVKCGRSAYVGAKESRENEKHLGPMAFFDSLAVLSCLTLGGLTLMASAAALVLIGLLFAILRLDLRNGMLRWLPYNLFPPIALACIVLAISMKVAEVSGR